MTTLTTASYNTAAGLNSGLLLTTGADNTLIGVSAGTTLTTGTLNVAVGRNALGGGQATNRNVAIGNNTLQSVSAPSSVDAYNVAIGYSSGGAVTTGIKNTFVGGLAGDATDDGNENTALGYSALSNNCGDSNTGIGYLALSVATGTNNTALGRTAGFEVSSGANNTLIGGDAGRTGSPGGAITTASNILSLGDENVATANIQVDWTVASDARDKTDFTALDLGLDFVKDLQPVTYKWDKRSKYGDKTADDYDLNAQTPDGTHKEDWLDIGFKAQEVEALEIAAGYNKDNKTNLVSSHSGDGKQMGLQYSKFVPILVKAIQEQNALIEALTARITTLEG
jgi:trimeric autotransporter adhesin